MRVKAPVLWVIARARSAIGGLVKNGRVTMIVRVFKIVRVTGMRLVPRMAVMEGRLAILMGMRR